MQNKTEASWPRRGRTSPLYLHTACLIIASLVYPLVIASVAEGATYYLDAVSGDDSNPGTSDQPWKTLSRAYTWYGGAGSKVQEGDTVIFRDGNYGQFKEQSTQESTVQRRTDWVTYKAATGHTPVLSKVYINNQDKWVPKEYGQSRIILDGFSVQDGISLYYTEYIQVKNCTVTLIPQYLTDMGYPTDGYNAPYVKKGSHTINTTYVSYVTVSDCNITAAEVALYFGVGSNLTATGNEIHCLGENAIKFASPVSDVLLEDNNCYDWNKRIAAEAICGTISGTFAPNDVVTQAGTNAEGVVHSVYSASIAVYETLPMHFLDAGDGGGAVSGPNGTIAIVTLVDPPHTDGIGFQGTGVNHVVIRGNRIIGPTAQGIKIENNTPGSMDDFLLENNLFYSLGQSLSITSITNLRLINNTFMDDPSNGIQGARFSCSKGDTTITEMYNNIIDTLNIFGDSGSYTNRVVSHGNNIFSRVVAGGPTYPFVLNSTEAVTSNLNALFTNAAGNDYTLAAGSAAINFGNPDYGPSSDILGNSRSGAPDAGCYEYIPADSNNHAPVLGEIGSKSVNENALLTFTVSTSDPDGDTVTYSASGLPAGATLSSPFTWTPGYDQAGTYNVTFVATDEHGAQSSPQTVTITVNNVNRPPVLAAIGGKSVNENATLTFSISATDADGDTITYSAQNPPTGATFSGQTFSWTPGYTQAGAYDVNFVASDRTDTDSETVTITVSNVNRAPVLAPIDNKSVSEGSILSFSLSATDADGDTVTYSASSLPAGSAFAGSTFTWTPGYTQAGSFQVTFTASDSQATYSQAVTITVNNTNRAPVLDAVADKSVNETTLLTFTLNATDADGDTIQYSATGLPSGATLSGQTFNWTPAHSQADNSYQVTFTAGDGTLNDSQTVTITVSDTSAPTITRCSPAADSIQAPVNNLITLHVTDDGKGVNAGTVTITLDGSTIYSGNTSNYVSATGNCRRTGTKADYTYAYQSNEKFDFDQTKTVTVNATDLGGNVMTQVSYSFRTEMRSFGQNKLLGSDIEGLDKGAPATARDTSGNIWAVWHAGPTGSRDIYLAKLAAGASAFGASTQITASNADQCNPAVAVGTDDKLYVVWQDNRRGKWDVYASTLSSLGTTWSAPERLTDSNDNQINPALAVDSRSPNRAHVVWQDDRAGNQDIYLATSSNAFVTNTVTRITSNTADQTDPAIAVDSSNTVYVVWTDARNSSTDIYGAAGSSWTNIPIVTKATDQSSPAIAAESAGSILHFLWTDQTSANSDIYYASSNGLPSSPLTGSNIIDDTSSADQISPAIAVTGSAGSGLKVFACWLDKRNVTGGNSDTDIYLVQTSSGHGTNVLVGDGSSNSAQSEPAMGIDWYGYPYVVWTDGRSTNTGIYYAASTYLQPTALTSQAITASSGGTVGADPNAITSADDVSIVVPAGACPYDVTISITKIENPQEFATRQLSSYDFSPSGLEFSQAVTVTIPYTVASSGTPPSAYWYDSLTGALSQQGITDIQTIQLSSTLHALRFKTTHFTPFYVVLGAAAAASGGGGGDGGGGGGGGGGCSMSPAGQGNIVEFLVPYLVLAVVMVILRLRDARNRMARTTAEGRR